MRISLDIQPRYIDDPLARKFWEVVKSNFQELSAGLANVVPSGNSPDITTIINNPDLTSYLYLPGKELGQTLQSASLLNTTFTIKSLDTFGNQTSDLLRFVTNADAVKAKVTWFGGIETTQLVVTAGGTTQILAIDDGGSYSQIRSNLLYFFSFAGTTSTEVRFNTALLRILGATYNFKCDSTNVQISRNSGAAPLLSVTDVGLKLWGNNVSSGNLFGVTHAVPSSIAANYTLTWPAATADGYIKNTAGVLSFDASVGVGTFQPLDADLTEIAALADVSGDMLYSDAVNTWQRLAGPSAANKVMRSTAANVFAWGSLVAGDIPDLSATYSIVGHTHAHSALTGIGANDHHAQSHVFATTTALGADHTVSGLTAGQVLRAITATTAAFQSLVAGDIPDLSATYSVVGHLHTGVYAPVAHSHLDAEIADILTITRISNLTAGLVRSAADGTLSVDTSAYLTGNQTVTLSGDVSGSGATAITATLASVITAGGPTGSTTVVPVITWDAKGRLTAVTTATIAFPADAVTSVFTRSGAVVAATNDYTWAQINKATSSLADITTRLISDTTGTLLEGRGGTGITALGAGIAGFLGAALPNFATGGGTATGTNTGDQTITLTGDVTGSGVGSFAATLASVGTLGTYRSVTTDAKGRVVAGTNPTTFAGYGISDTAANLLTAITGVTGTGNLVFATSPTLVTPLLGTPTSGVLTNCTGLPVAGGGTGQITALLAFNALSPLTTQGDLITRDATNNIRLPIVAINRVLRSTATDPTWAQGDIDFGGFKAIAMACDNGATFPTPTEGMWFLYTPGSRRVLHQRVNSAWVPMFAFGATTIAVATTGNDSTGTGEAGAPYLTIQKAFDQIAAISSGNVTISIGAGSFAGATLIGKSFSGNYTITIYGNGTPINTVVMDGTGSTGSVTTQPTLVHSAWPAAVAQGSIVHFDNSTNYDLYRVVNSKSGSTLTLCGNALTTTPVTTHQVSFFPFDTIITSLFTIGVGQGGVSVFYIKFAQRITLLGVSTLIQWCVITNTSGTTAYVAGSNTSFRDVALINNGTDYGDVLFVSGAVAVGFEGTLLTGAAGSTALGARFYAGASGSLSSGTVIDGLIWGLSGEPGQISFFSATSNVFIKNCGNGLNVNNQLITRGMHLYTTRSGNYIDVLPYIVETTQGIRRTAVADTNYSALSTDDVIAYTSLTAARSVTLPAVASVGAGKVLMIKDETTTAAHHASNHPITVVGTIDNNANKIINTNAGFIRLYCNGTDWWTLGSL